jgi:Domain of unknown function (DUF5916)/Carbohydrate family 9 binding domain-like
MLFLSRAFLSVFLLSQAVYAQEVMIHAVRVQDGPVIDGKLDDKAWDYGIAFSDFKMVEPVPGSQPSEQTEVRVVYDNNSLNIGIRCYDRDPKHISANNMQHDFSEAERSEDQVRILLDPFQDKRTAYLFIVNPRGARSEGFADGEHFSLDWNGIWDAKSRIDSEGWAVEIQIPFKTISFNPKLHAWGINMERYIARKQEFIRLSGIGLNIFFNNPQEATLMSGIDSVRQGWGLTLRPYGLGSLYRDRSTTDKISGKFNSGFDIYKNITPSLVGAITFNTDFAETEVDERLLNLTRFPLYYPEKRTFFLEGSDIFNFDTGSNFIPFFSRNIGLYNGEQVPINWGAKVYGKAGNTNISALDVTTGGIDSLSPANLFAARISENIFKQSKAGIILTNGNPSGAKNTLAGADFTYKTSRMFNKYNFSAGGWGVYNWNESKGGHKEAYGMKLDFPNDLLDMAVVYNYFGDSINPALSFLPRKAYHYLYSGVAYQPRPEKGLIGRLVRQWFFEFRVTNYWNLSGNLESRQVFTAPVNVQTESGEHIEFNVIPNREVLPYDFEVSNGVTIPKGDYPFVNYRFELNTAGYRKIVGDLSYRFGQFYDGRYDDINVAVTFKADGYATLQLGAEFVRGYLPAGNFSENVYQAKLKLYLNPNFGLLNYLQFDDVSDQMGYNGRLFWRVRPGNTIYLVYNSNWLRQWNPETRFIAGEQQISLKLQISIRL